MYYIEINQFHNDWHGMKVTKSNQIEAISFEALTVFSGKKWSESKVLNCLKWHVDRISKNCVARVPIVPIFFSVWSYTSTNSQLLMEIQSLEPILGDGKKSRRNSSVGVQKALNALGFGTWNELQLSGIRCIFFNGYKLLMGLRKRPF